jgi:hypothetical protein
MEAAAAGFLKSGLPLWVCNELCIRLEEIYKRQRPSRIVTVEPTRLLSGPVTDIEPEEGD